MFAPEKPITDNAKITKLHCQRPYGIKNNTLVDKIPKKAKITKKPFLFFERSAIAPKIGAINTIINPAAELAVPSNAVDVASSRFPAQNDLKKRGKNPARTVVANTELAQS